MKSDSKHYNLGISLFSDTCPLLSDFTENMQKNPILAKNYASRYLEIEDDCDRIINSMIKEPEINMENICCDWDLLGKYNFQYFSKYNEKRQKYYFDSCNTEPDYKKESILQLCHFYCIENL